MTDAFVDSHSPGRALRRRWRLLVTAAVIGLAAGGGYLTQEPPQLVSNALVLLPPVGEARGSLADAATQAEIVTSATVLGPVGAAMDPPVSVRTLQRKVEVGNPTDQLLEIKAYAADGQVAQRTAQAVADTYVAYVRASAAELASTALSSLTARQTALQNQLDDLGAEITTTSARLATEASTSAEAKRDAQLLAELRAEQSGLALRLDQIKEQIATTAPPGTDPASGTSVIQPASEATGRPLLWQIVVWPLLGGVIATLLAAGSILARSRRDRRLRSRDEIADAAGVTVLASLQARPQRTVTGWSRLLAGYRPGPVDAWAVRRLLRDLAPGEARTGRGRGGRRPTDHPSSLVVLSLSGDVKGLAIGPQIAACAASFGIATRLVTGPRPALALGASQPRESSTLTVTLTQLDRLAPKPHGLPRAGTVLLAVGAGRCTEDDLARLTMTLHETGHRLGGVVVADPDRTDRSTGRLLADEDDDVVLPLRITGGMR